MVAAEIEMLLNREHRVELLEADNKTIGGTLSKIAAAGSLFHSPSSSRTMARLIQTFRPDIVHIHNWFPLLSPSIISVASCTGVPVVQTLHNFRMFCANSSLYRDGKVCLDCAGKVLPLDGVKHGCYSDSRVGSALVTAAFSYHRLARTWDGISTFIAVSEFQRELLVGGGVSSAQIVVKPNFVKDPGGPGSGEGGYALFAGRISELKGIRTVLQAWEQHSPRMPLKIMGDGPLAAEVRTRAAKLARVEYLGQRSASEVAAAMGDARFLIFASESYEPHGRTIVEAFSQGTPILAANLRSATALIENGVTGLLFDVGDAADLAAKAAQFVGETPAYREMRQRCRRLYEERYTEAQNYKMLIGIYTEAIAAKRGTRRLDRLMAAQDVHSFDREAL